MTRELNDGKEDLLSYARKIITNTQSFKFFIGVLYEVHFMTSFKPSDLGGCFSGDAWTQNEVMEIPCRVGTMMVIEMKTLTKSSVTTLLSSSRSLANGSVTGRLSKTKIQINK